MGGYRAWMRGEQTQHAERCTQQDARSEEAHSAARSAQRKVHRWGLGGSFLPWPLC